MQKNTRHNSGFTLMELVTVMIVVGILAVFVMPRMFDLTAFRQRGFFDELIQATRYAQKLAVTSGCAVRIVIGGGGFTMDQPTTPPPSAACSSGGSWGTAVTIPGTAGPYNAPSGVSVTSTATIIFLPSGAADNGPTVTVHGSGDLSFTVNQTTGYVQ